MKLLVIGAIGVGASALGICAGLWAGHASMPERSVSRAAKREVRIGLATLTVPRAWRIISPRAGDGGTQGRKSLALAPVPGRPDRLVATVAPPADESLVPAALRALVRDLGRGPRQIRIGGHRAWRYAALPARDSDGALDLTVLPTTAGVLGIACASTGSSWNATAGCSSSIGSISIEGAAILVPSRDLAFRLTLPSVLTALDQARVSGRAALRQAATAGRQAQVARALGRAHLAASASLRPVAGRAGAPLIERLANLADAYFALGRAAAASSASRFDGARQSVRSAEVQLSVTVDNVAPRTAREPADAPPGDVGARETGVGS